MTPEQFCYWLQGSVETRMPINIPPSEKEWLIIVDHLQQVFNKKTPIYIPFSPITPLIPKQGYKWDYNNIPIC